MNTGLKERILALRASGMSYKKICREIGCNIGTVSYYCSGDGVNLTGIVLSQEKINEIKMLRQTHTAIETSKITGVCVTTVNKYASSANVGIKLTDDERIRRSRDAVRTHRKKLKIKAVQYMGGKCKLCGYDRCYDALDFHHTNESEKRFNFSQHFNRKWETLKPELDKCILVCATCHREIHAGLHDEVVKNGA